MLVRQRNRPGPAEPERTHGDKFGVPGRSGSARVERKSQRGLHFLHLGGVWWAPSPSNGQRRAKLQEGGCTFNILKAVSLAQPPSNMQSRATIPEGICIFISLKAVSFVFFLSHRESRTNNPEGGACFQFTCVSRTHLPGNRHCRAEIPEWWVYLPHLGSVSWVPFPPGLSKAKRNSQRVGCTFNILKVVSWTRSPSNGHRRAKNTDRGCIFNILERLHGPFAQPQAKPSENPTAGLHLLHLTSVSCAHSPSNRHSRAKFQEGGLYLLHLDDVS